MDPFARALAESQPTAILFSSADGKTLFTNPPWRSLMTGVSECDPDSWRTIIDPLDRNRLDRDLAAGLAGGTSTFTQVRIRSADGSLRWWTLSQIPVSDSGGDGKDGWMTVLARTIDRGRPADVAWTDSENLTEAERGSLSGAWDWHIDTGSLWWSDEVFRIFGLQPQEFAATYDAFLQRVHPDDRDELTRLLDLALKGIERYDLRHRVIRPDGTLRYVREQGLIIRSADGTPNRMLGTVLDITESTLVAMARASAHEDLLASERRYRMLAENATDIVWQRDPQGRITWISPSVEPVLGWRPEDLIGSTPPKIVHPDDLGKALDGLACMLRGEGVDPFELRLLSSDGGERWMSLKPQLIVGSDGKALAAVGGLRDIHDEVLARQALIDSESHYRLLAENASDVVLQIGAEGSVIWASESVGTVLGWRPDQILGGILPEFVHPEDQHRAQSSSEAAITGESSAGEFRVKYSDGTYRWMQALVHVARHDGQTSQIVALRDIQDEVDTRERLAHAMEHDLLTGLPSRTVAVAYLDRLLALPTSGDVGVLCVGIDSLKAVNEALTHAGGDHVIATIATRIGTFITDPGLLARGSGDEFLVLIPDLTSGADAAIVAEAIRTAAKGSLAIEGHQLQPTVSIGIATSSKGMTAADLVRDASLAMHHAKERGRDRYEFAQAHLAEEAQRRLEVEDGVRAGLRDSQFVPWFQPIVNLDGGEIVGYEALIRWVRPDGTVVPPADFMPIAERSALIVDLDLTVLEQSIALLSTLPLPVHVSVNVSAATLTSIDYSKPVAAALARYGADPKRLHLEVTETALLSVTEPIRRAMNKLASSGVRWYVDDFGTGYSSITHLRDLPIAGLKLDLSFTSGLGAGDRKSVRLAKALAGLAEGLKLDTVAEGVETDAEASILAAQGWRHGQGWLFGRPEPMATEPEDRSDWLPENAGD